MKFIFIFIYKKHSRKGKIKMEKQKRIVRVMIAALLSVGTFGAINSAQTAQATKTTHSISLKHNAYVYNKSGIRKSKKSLKKGRRFVTYGLKTIKGKKYYILSKGRFIKASNVAGKKPNSKNKYDLAIKLLNSAPVFNSKGYSLGITFKKGLITVAKGKAKIKGQEYYALKNNRFIKVNEAKLIDDKPTSISNVPTQSIQNNANSNQNESKNDKPTQKEIDYLLKEKGYVYFSDKELAQIKNYLWEKIQNYRVENGYEKYKSNQELDAFIKKVSSSSNNMFLYSEDINNQEIAKYLPTLASKGMNAVQAVDHYKYYGNYIGAPANFNLYDRNTEHVATEIFNSLKNDPFYENKIVGLFDKKAFASLGLNYNWDGTYSTVGLVFIEVAGTGTEWTNYYNAN